MNMKNSMRYSNDITKDGISVINPPNKSHCVIWCYIFIKYNIVFEVEDTKIFVKKSDLKNNVVTEALVLIDTSKDSIENNLTFDIL